MRRPRDQLLQAAADAREQRRLLVLRRRGRRGLRLPVRTAGRLGLDVARTGGLGRRGLLALAARGLLDRLATVDATAAATATTLARRPGLALRRAIGGSFGRGGRNGLVRGVAALPGRTRRARRARAALAPAFAGACAPAAAAARLDAAARVVGGALFARLAEDL